MNNLDKILDRIKKLLSLSHSSNENEAALAAAQVQKLLLKHNLSLADLGKAEIEAETRINEELIWESGRMPAWRTYLVSGVARAFGCRPLVTQGRRYTALKMVGSSVDITVAKVTLEYLEMVVDDLTTENAYGRGKRYVNSYRVGLVARLTARLAERAKANEAEVMQEASEAGTALVLRKQGSLSDYFRDNNYTGKYKTGKSELDYEGYGAGIRDAENVGLNQQLGEKNKTKWRMTILQG
tara:strand:- start:3436 stop:4155 length:720 start_codon:yes stop_codon:yes gene_type:complete